MPCWAVPARREPRPVISYSRYPWTSAGRLCPGRFDGPECFRNMSEPRGPVAATAFFLGWGVVGEG
jgi:hypothetical protein